VRLTRAAGSVSFYQLRTPERVISTILGRLFRSTGIFPSAVRRGLIRLPKDLDGRC